MKHYNYKKIVLIVGVVVIAMGSFYGGMQYGKSNVQIVAQGFMGRTGQGISGMNRRTAGGGFVGGDILSKDAQSITLKLRTGGSKIIFYSSSTEISKFASGTTEDLSVGSAISVNGTVNSDGSISAQTIQMRPSMMPQGSVRQ